MALLWVALGITGIYAFLVWCWLLAFGVNGAPDFVASLRVALRWPQILWNWDEWNNDALALHGYGPKAKGKDDDC